jgi:chromosome segregation ATPase
MLKLSDLRAAMADKAQLATDLATAQSQLAQLQADLLAANAKADGFSSQIAEANTLIESLNGKVATLETEKKTVAETTIETIAELGIAASDLPKASGSVVDEKDIYTQWKALSGGEKQSYFRANRAALERYAASQN